MLSFVIRYLVVAIVGTTLIYYIPFSAPTEMTPLPDEDTDELVSHLDDERGPPPTSSRRPRPVPAKSARVSPATPRGTENRTADPTVTTPETIVENVTLETEAPTSSIPVPATSAPITHWGVAIRDAPLYSTAGKRLSATLPGGSLVVQSGSGSSSRGDVALCHGWYDNQWQGPWLIDTADLVRFEGDHSEISDSELAPLLRYGRLRAQIAARRDILTKGDVESNPHTSRLRQLKSEYDDAAARAAKLTAQRDEATGAARNRMADELRRLKEEEGRMRREIEAATTRYNEWKNRNTGSAADPSKDPQIREWTGQLNQLMPHLRQFGF